MAEWSLWDILRRFCTKTSPVHVHFSLFASLYSQYVQLIYPLAFKWVTVKVGQYWTKYDNLLLHMWLGGSVVKEGKHGGSWRAVFSLDAGVAIALLLVRETSGKGIKPFKEVFPMKSAIRSSYIWRQSYRKGLYIKHNWNTGSTPWFEMQISNWFFTREEIPGDVWVETPLKKCRKKNFVVCV